MSDSSTDSDHIGEDLSSVSSEQLAGQVLVAGFPQKGPSAELLDWAAQGALGGFILFRRNLPDLATTAELTRKLQRTSESPLLIGVDQEGGRVKRLDAPVLPLPPMRQLGRVNDPALTHRSACLVGQQLRYLGFNWNFAPVLDVDSNPDNPVIGDRAFGSYPELVITHGRAFMAGLASGGVLPCGKHFPGHGDTIADSHNELPSVIHRRERLEDIELAPFRALARELPSVMTAHVVYPALDPNNPATMSLPVVSGLLRKRLGFSGLVVSDDLEMGAIVRHTTVGKAAVRAVGAGCDALLVCSSQTMLGEARQALTAQAEQDKGFRKRLESAARRVRRSAKRWAVPKGPNNPVEAVEQLYAEQGIPLLQEISERLQEQLKEP